MIAILFSPALPRMPARVVNAFRHLFRGQSLIDILKYRNFPSMLGYGMCDCCLLTHRGVQRTRFAYNAVPGIGAPEYEEQAGGRR
jgi:hypothetical protein